MLFCFSLLVKEETVGYTHKPSLEAGQAAEVTDVLPSADESLLSQVIGPHRVAVCQALKETPHGGLMCLHKFGKGLMAPCADDLRYED